MTPWPLDPAGGEEENHICPRRCDIVGGNAEKADSFKKGVLQYIMVPVLQAGGDSAEFMLSVCKHCIKVYSAALEEGDSDEDELPDEFVAALLELLTCWRGLLCLIDSGSMSYFSDAELLCTPELGDHTSLPAQIRAVANRIPHYKTAMSEFNSTLAATKLHMPAFLELEGIVKSADRTAHKLATAAESFFKLSAAIRPGMLEKVKSGLETKLKQADSDLEMYLVEGRHHDSADIASRKLKEYLALFQAVDRYMPDSVANSAQSVIVCNNALAELDRTNHIAKFNEIVQDIMAKITTENAAVDIEELCRLCAIVQSSPSLAGVDKGAMKHVLGQVTGELFKGKQDDMTFARMLGVALVLRPFFSDADLGQLSLLIDIFSAVKAGNDACIEYSSTGADPKSQVDAGEQTVPAHKVLMAAVASREKIRKCLAKLDEREQGVVKANFLEPLEEYIDQRGKIIAALAAEKLEASFAQTKALAGDYIKLDGGGWRDALTNNSDWTTFKAEARRTIMTMLGEEFAAGLALMENDVANLRAVKENYYDNDEYLALLAKAETFLTAGNTIKREAFFIMAFDSMADDKVRLRRVVRSAKKEPSQHNAVVGQSQNVLWCWRRGLRQCGLVSAMGHSLNV